MSRRSCCLLAGVHVARRQAFDFQRPHLGIVAGEDLGVGGVADERDLASRLREHGDELAAKIFLVREQSNAFLAAR